MSEAEKVDNESEIVRGETVSGVHPTERAGAQNLDRAEGSHPWPGGTKFGDYDIESFIGFGGWASVYRAHHPVHGTVALKVMGQKHLEAEDALERFERERTLLARAEHPNVVRSYDGGVIDGSPYLAMELLSGEDLDATVMRRQALEPGSVVAILDQALAALQAVHDADVVHRDFKPGNLFVDITGGEPRIVLVDFGIALGGGDRLTEEGRINGTPHYLSPEQVGGQDVNDPRVDVFAAGVVAYELLSGTTPFPSLGLGELMIAILQRDAPKLDHVPDALNAVVAKAMARDIDERYQSADEFREALAAWADSAGVPTRLEAGGFGIVPKSTVPLTLRPLTRSTGSKFRQRRARAKRKAVAKAFALAAAAALCMFIAFRLGLAAEDEGSTAVAALPAAQASPAVDNITGEGSSPEAQASATLGMHAPENPAPSDQAPSAHTPSAQTQGAQPQGARTPSAQSTRTPGAQAPSRTQAARHQASNSPAQDVDPSAAQQAADDSGEREPAAPAAQVPNVESLLASARRHHLRGRHSQAMQTYRQATRADRRNAEAWRGLGLVSVRLGLNAQASASLRRYLRLSPRASDRAQVQRQLASLTE